MGLLLQFYPGIVHGHEHFAQMVAFVLHLFELTLADGPEPGRDPDMKKDQADAEITGETSDQNLPIDGGPVEVTEKALDGVRLPGKQRDIADQLQPRVVVIVLRPAWKEGALGLTEIHDVILIMLRLENFYQGTTTQVKCQVPY